MFKTEPFVAEKPWGYENWIISTHTHGASLIDDEKSLEHMRPISRAVGGEYPILVKLIQANETLSVQVHPDDDYARRVEGTYGKNECWYVLDALPGAEIIAGLAEGCTRDGLKAALSAGESSGAGETSGGVSSGNGAGTESVDGAGADTASGSRAAVEAKLRTVPISKGDFVFIPSGTVHAIKGGLRLLEVQEPSDITYRLYDWGRKREMHIQKGLDVIKFDDPACTAPRVVHGFEGLFETPYFSLEKVTIDDMATESKRVIRFSETERRWAGVVVLDGIAELSDAAGNTLIVQAEETVMLPRTEKLTVTSVAGGPVTLMKIW